MFGLIQQNKIMKINNNLNNSILLPQSGPYGDLLPKVRDKINLGDATLDINQLSRYFGLVMSLYPIKDKTLSRVMEKLLQSIHSRWSNHGAKYTVEYLKECNRLMMFFIAGNPTKSNSRLVGSAQGLPVIIPRCHRALLLKLNKDKHLDFMNVSKVILALFGLYRVISYKGELKLNTITDIDDSPGLPEWEVKYAIERRFRSLFKRNNVKLYNYNLLTLQTAGPNHSTSILSAPYDALALSGKDIMDSILVLSNYFSLNVYNILRNDQEVLKGSICDKDLRLGKLSIKDEPAGKRRVFAIVDIFTQSVLKPIHDHVFSILKDIKEDGAFDQIGPVRRMIARNTHGNTWCFDLSAATDRFPIKIQMMVLEALYNKEVANAWKHVLVGRPYYLGETKQEYYYGAGQPMGALSSWGVFALTHHIIIQMAAIRVGVKDWFTEYSLLGDDVAITNEDVANEYYNIMTKELNVAINLSKSLQSKGSGIVEFAKRIIGPTGDYSSVGPKNLALALKSKLYIPSVLIDAKEKGLNIDYFSFQDLLSQWIKTGLYKFTFMEKVAFTWSLLEPFGFIPSFGRMAQKWDKLFKLESDEVIGNLSKLSDFLIDEWKLEHSRSLSSIASNLKRYESWLSILDSSGSFIHTSMLKSISEQRLKLIEEYLRVSSLEPPRIVIDSSFDYCYECYLYDKEGEVINARELLLSTPVGAVSDFLSFIAENLPDVTPQADLFEAGLNLRRRSIRNLSFSFLKKFIGYYRSVS